MTSASFSARLSRAFRIVSEHTQSVLIGALVFAFLAGTLQYVFIGSVATIGTGAANEMGLDVGKMEELGRRASTGDEQAQREMEEYLEGAMEEFVGMSDAEVMAELWPSLMPSVGKFFTVSLVMVLVSTLLNILAYTYYMLIVIRKSDDTFALLSDTIGAAIPMIGVWLWMFLRSFAWIPFLGWIIALIIGPRFVLAPYLYLTERKGAFAGVRESEKKTKGKWGLIVGTMLLAALVSFLPLGIISGIIGRIIGGLGSIFLGAFATQIANAYLATILVLLSQEVLGARSTGKTAH